MTALIYLMPTEAREMEVDFGRTASDYARYRAHLHAHATREIAGALASGRRDTAQRLADGWNRADGLFGALDARRLPR